MNYFCLILAVELENFRISSINFQHEQDWMDNLGRRGGVGEPSSPELRRFTRPTKGSRGEVLGGGWRSVWDFGELEIFTTSRLMSNTSKIGRIILDEGEGSVNHRRLNKGDLLDQRKGVGGRCWGVVGEVFGTLENWKILVFLD